jgi:3D (Asp-Asp-Asp) domain-containing protein
VERPRPILRALLAIASAGLALALALPGARGAWRHAGTSTRPVPVTPGARPTHARTTLELLAGREEQLAAAQSNAAVELSAARRDLAAARRHLEQRLRELYEDGEPHPLEVILGARSLGQAITDLDNLERTARQDRAWIARAQTLRRRLTALSRSLAARREAIHRLRLSAAAAIAALREPRAPTPQPAVRAALPRPHGAPAARTTLTVVASAYAIPGATATGTTAARGTIAVDPAVIPLGTALAVPGYGSGIASDTGSAVRDARIDVWFPTIEEALAWGTRTVTVTIYRG